MTKKRSSVLPTKINELDRQITKAFSDQLDNLSLQLIHADIEQRLTFVKNLLSAEMASHPTKQNYLEHMWERVRELEAVYRGSGTGSGTTVSTIDHVDNVGDCDEDDDDHASKCSGCSESCIQDGGDVSDDLESTLGQDTGDCVDLVEEKKAMPVTVFDNVLFEEKVDDDRVEDEFHDRVEYVLFDDTTSHDGAFVVEDGNDEKEFRVEDGNGEKETRTEVDMIESEKQSKGLGFGKLCWAVVMSGFLIGMALLTMDSLEYDGYDGHGQFLTPT